MKTILPIFLLFVSSSVFAQSKIGITAAINYIDLQTIDNPENSGYGYRYLVPLQGKEKIMPSVGLKFEQKINEKFYADYQARLSYKWFDFDANPDPRFIIISELSYLTRFFISTQSVSFSMNLNPGFSLGLGGFFRAVGRQPTYLFDRSYSRPIRHAGFLLKSSYKIKKWQIEARYLKSIGEADVPSSLNTPSFKAMDTFELSITYMFLQFKKREKRKSK